MTTDPETLRRLNQVEYWLMKPFSLDLDKDLLYIKQVTRILQSLQTDLPGTDDFDLSIKELTMAFKENKFKYSYVEREQIKKGISAMSGSVFSRILSKQLSPVVSKVADKVLPTVSDAYNNGVVPAANKTLKFLHKVFVKPKNVPDTE